MPIVNFGAQLMQKSLFDEKLITLSLIVVCAMWGDE